MKKTFDFYAFGLGRLLMIASLSLPLSALADEVRVADSNGNELRYSFDADGPATFTGVYRYSADADKAGRIVIADRVTDANGTSHNVLYIGGSLSNRSNIVSVVFGQNIIATGGADGESSSAFYYCSKLESVTLNSKLQILGRYTFQGCYKLSSINLAEATSLTTIKYGCFNDADYLRSLTLPASVESLEQSAFNSIDSLRTVTIPAGSKLEEIGPYAFQSCGKLQSINLEAATQLKTLSNNCFRYCYELKSITIPASVETFGSNILEYCNTLETITFNAANVPNNFYRYGKELRTINLGAGVKSIGESAFYDNDALTNINIADGVDGLAIGKQAFNDCDQLRTLALPKGVVSLGESAFYGCDSLRTVNIAKGSRLDSIARYAFAYNYKLQSINLEAATQLRHLMYRVFYDCTDLQSITIPASVVEFGNEYYGADLLGYCKKIESITFLAANVPDNFYRGGSGTILNTVNIGPGVKRIGNRAFGDNYYLKNLNIDANVSDLVIGEYAFTEDDRLDNVILPKGVIALEKAAFRSCDSMYVFTIAEGSPIKNIPQECFYYCLCLQKLNLPDAVQTVENSAFGYCRAMTEITFGSALTSLPDDWYLFYNCNQLQKVTLPGVNYPFVREIWLPENAVYYVHPDLLDMYRTNDFTKNRRAIAIGQPMDFAVTTSAGSQLQAQVESKGDPNNLTKLTVTGPINGTDIDYIHGSLPNLQYLDLSAARIVEGGDSYHRWNVSSNGNATIYSDYWDVTKTENDVVGHHMFRNMPMLKSIKLPQGITSIGDYAFCDNRQMATVGLSTGMTAIGSCAFRYTGIRQVTVPAGVTRIEAETFYDCDNLKTVSLPDGITYIGVSAFSQCDSLETVNIPGQVETIDNYAFYGNYCKTSPIVIPATCKKIGSEVFNNNYLVSSITLNEGLESIGYQAFRNCRKVREVKLPESITNIGQDAFCRIDSLREFTFPSNIKEVPSGVLYYSQSLERVTLAEGTTKIGYEAFYDSPKLKIVNLNQPTLTTIERYAFYHTGLTNVVLPNQITKIENDVFRDCKDLESINVPTGIDYIPCAFVRGCPKVKTVITHDGIRIVQSWAFESCHSLKSVTLSDQITTIEHYAFSSCDSLVLDRLPAALSTIEYYAFYGTKSIHADLTLPALTHIEYNAFDGSGITGVTLPDGMTHIGNALFANCRQLKRVKLPADIKTITRYMFQSTDSLQSIELPDSVRRIEYCGFESSGLTSIELPDSLEYIETYAFGSTKLRSIRVPDGVKTVEWGFAQNSKRLKSAYLGRNMDYTHITDFNYFNYCDSLELLRVYAGTPPAISEYYTRDYRANCVLEVPEDQVETYKATDVWKDFKEIRGFFSGDELDDADFAVLQDLYDNLGGASWSKKWDLTNNHNPNGKWAGVTTAKRDGAGSNVYSITSIDLADMGVTGQLPASLFQLKQLQKVNLAHNHISGDLGTYAVRNASGITELNLEGNCFTGDLYPLVSQMPLLTSLNVAYNQISDISQPLPKDKLSYGNIHIEMQFVDWRTYETANGINDALVQDVTVGVPFTLQPTTLFTYRHDNQDYGHNATSLARPYYDSWWRYDWEFNTYDGQLNLGKNSDNYFRAPKNTPVVFSDLDWHWRTVLLRFDWKDGDVNADQTVDVTDLQSVVYHALNDRKADGQMFNFTAADANNDANINVSDIVGSVDYILGYVETDNSPLTSHLSPFYYNRAPASQQNILSVDGSNVVLTHPDAVAALQITISGAAIGQLRVSEALKSQFSVAMREVADGIRLVVWSAEGHTLMPGVHQLLTGLPAGAVVTDVRLSDSEARHLDVTNEGAATSISIANYQLSIDDAPVFDLSGRRLGAWDTLPEGIYVIHINGKQYKVKK
jgi:Leucine-rich repeat (LRR) protein